MRADNKKRTSNARPYDKKGRLHMKTNKTETAMRRVLVTLIVYLSVILAALLVVAFPEIAPLVAGLCIALALGRLIWLLAWGAAKNGYGWRI